MAPLLQITEPDEPSPSTESAVVGIDLGTTHSLVAYVNQDDVRVLELEPGIDLVPSLVAYDHNKSIAVGQKAQEYQVKNPSKVAASTKRLLNSRATLAESIKVGQSKVTAIEVATEILRYLKQQAESVLQQRVDQAVITVPAYFDERARAATRDAARLAGLEVLRVISEPTAAALAYGLDTSAEGVYAIYDLGGGTFDLSLLSLSKGVFRVLATGGDSHLGGDDFDEVLLEFLLHEREQQLGSFRFEAADRRLALLQARSIKEALTRVESGKWLLTVQEKTSEHSLNVHQLNTLFKPLVDRTIEITEKVLQDADLKVQDIQGLVLVGGGTRVPLVQQRVKRTFGQTGLCTIDPDRAVVRGAALQAKALSQGASSLLLDVTPLSLGIETIGDVVEKIIVRNSPIPVSCSQEFTTYQDGQTQMKIHVVQGEREQVRDCRSLAQFILHDLPAMPAGNARIEVTFTLDADGLLQVQAREKITGRQQSVEVKPSYGLTDDAVYRLLNPKPE